MSSLRAVSLISILLLLSGGAQPFPLVSAGPSLSREQWRYIDVTATHLPPSTRDTKCLDATFVDVDGDGDLDLATANYGDEVRGRELTPYRILLNVAGVFALHTSDVFPRGATGHGFDLEAGDLNQDGVPDFYLCSGRSQDRLLLSRMAH